MMITTYDDEDVERAASALREQFYFSRHDNSQFTNTNAAIEHHRKVSKEISEKAARTQFDAMGLVYVPVPEAA